MLQKLADKPSGWGRLGDPRKRHDPVCGLALCAGLAGGRVQV